MTSRSLSRFESTLCVCLAEGMRRASWSVCVGLSPSFRRPRRTARERSLLGNLTLVNDLEFRTPVKYCVRHAKFRSARGVQCCCCDPRASLQSISCEGHPYFPGQLEGPSAVSTTSPGNKTGAETFTWPPPPPPPPNQKPKQPPLSPFNTLVAKLTPVAPIIQRIRTVGSTAINCRHHTVGREPWI
ncbi:hypothetical protein DFH07DRAFT_15273 [Mycena maculata]|uniref:Uncharacterized protein n=1 Tax=Mycena maculata TaxID=230809 RepID=A0AAD7INQ1_9AGAR|nr:hypothetical protein DFH07DRAFT_15273 [Mycena maculata]